LPEDTPQSEPRAGGTFAYLVSNVIEGAFALLFTIILVRLISQHDFGAWRQFISLFFIGSSILVFGLPKSLLYFYSTAGTTERSRIAIRSLILILLLSLFSAALFFSIRGFIADAYSSPALSTYAGLFSLYLLLYFPLLIFQSLLIAAGRRRQLAIWKTAFAVTRLSTLLYVYLAGGTLLNLLVILVVHQALQLAVSLIIYLRISGFRVSGLWSGSAPQMRYSSHVTLQSIAGGFMREVDKILVSVHYTPERFAPYAVGARELPLIDLIPYAVGDAITPELSNFHLKKQISDFLDLWHRWLKRISIVIYPLLGLIIFQHRQIITVLYTADYVEGAIPLLIFGLIIPLRLTSFQQIVLAMNQSRAVVIGSIMGLVINLIIGYAAIRTIGIVGPAFGVLIAEWILNSFYLSRIRRGLEIRWRELLPWRFLIRVMALALITAGLATVSGFVTQDWSPLPALIAYGILFGILYLAGVRLLKLVGVDDLSKLKKTLGLK